MEAEERRGTYVFYTQTYRDGQHRPVFFNGSVFGVIQQMQANECEIKLETDVTDLYTGSIGKNQIRKTASVYRWLFDFTLTSEIADALHVVELRPAQLDNGTNPLCTAKPGCTFEWIEVKAALPVIKETEITNDFAGYDGYVKDFDGMVDHFLIPISSSTAGDDLIAKLKVLAHACGKIGALR